MISGKPLSLLEPQPIRKPALGQFDIRVGDGRVPGNVADLAPMVAAGVLGEGLKGVHDVTRG